MLRSLHVPVGRINPTNLTDVLGFVQDSDGAVFLVLDTCGRILGTGAADDDR